MTKKKVLIGIPFGRPLDLPCHLASVALIVRASVNSECEVSGKYPKTAYLGYNRDVIAQTSLDRGCDWCLMIDTDMTYPETLLDVLVSRDKDVIGVPYYSPRWEVTGSTVVPLIYDYDKEKQGWHKWQKVKQTQPFRVDGVGGGILLIKTKVFKQLKKPWFPYLAYETKEGTKVMSEDLAFCLACMNEGIEVWVDPTFGDSIEHWKPYGYSLKDCTEK